MINLRQIEVFRAVMVAGSVVRAARLLSVSQPAVSRLLRHTEDRLGFKLFERKHGRLFPTDEARALHREVERAYGGVQTVIEMARELASGKSGLLRVICNPSLSLAVVPAAIARFRSKRPDVRILLDVQPMGRIVETIISQQADIGFGVFTDDHPSVEIEPVCRGRLVCILPKAHSLARQPFIRPRDLKDQPLVLYRPDTPQAAVLEDILGGELDIEEAAIRVRYGFTACAIVNTGTAIGLSDEFTAKASAFPDIAVRPFRPVRYFRYDVIRNRYRPLSVIAAAFRDDLRAVLTAQA